MSNKPGCLIGILKVIVDAIGGEKKCVDGTLPYALRDDFLSADELSLYSTMVAELGDEWVVCPKVGLGDLFFVAHGGDYSKKQTYLNKIQRKHADFVICDAQTMTPRLLVELDDSSHKKLNRQERDRFVDEVCQAAGIEIVHVKSKAGYSRQDIVEFIVPKLSAKQTDPTDIAIEDRLPEEPKGETTYGQVCPKCGSSMILRKARQGNNAGNEFYGCSEYPKCRGMRSVDGTAL